MSDQATYPEILDYLYRQLPMYQRIGSAAFKKNLDNIRSLCLHLQQPEQNFASIHIAGTNGKGSTAHVLAAILQASGYRVGLYTSPHYKDFRERIKIDGQLMSKSFVVEWVGQHRYFFEQIKPSFFEITVAMAFDYFSQRKVDIAVVETGLGGRLDSTNILQPLLSIITNISLDHQQFLGNTLPQIAAEKAGIIKKHTPVVIGETHPETREVFEAKARKEEASIWFADQHFKVRKIRADLPRSLYSVWRNGKPFLRQFATPLHGSYQEKNIATAFQAVEVLQQAEDFPKLNIESVKSGLYDVRKLTRFIGRWEVISEAPLIILDSAHNEEGLRQTLQQLRQLPHRQWHIVLGTVKDKDLRPLLSLMPSEARYYFAKADVPRGLPAEQLKVQAKSHGLKGRSYRSVKNAYRAAKRQADDEDLIFVGGSIFVVAEVL